MPGYDGVCQEYSARLRDRGHTRFTRWAHRRVGQYQPTDIEWFQALHGVPYRPEM